MNAPLSSTALGALAAAEVDVVTVLRSRGPVLAKTWQVDGEIKPYGDALWYTVAERAVHDLASLAAVLREVQDDPRAAVIRGRLRSDWQAVLNARLPAWNADRAKRDKQPLEQPDAQHVLRRRDLFDDVPHYWLAIDVDGFRPLATDPVHEAEAAIEEFIATLPNEFHQVSYHWQLSNSAGAAKHAGVLKAHLWFWLAHPVDSSRLKAWAEGVGPSVDSSLYQSVQLHYTAAPVFAHGVVDPVPRRDGLADWSLLSDAVDVEMPVPPARAVQPRASEPGGDAAAREFVDPRKKPGLIGAFHRAFTIEQVLAEFLPDQFDSVGGDRLTWRGGSGAAEGARVCDDRQRIVASHNTWPWGVNNAVITWDLVRHFKFGHLDHVEGDDLETAILAGGPPHLRPSNAAMESMAKMRPEVQAALADDDPDKVVDTRLIIERLRSLPRDQVPLAWKPLALPLPADALAEVIDEVHRLTGAGVRALKAAFNEIKAKEVTRRKTAAALARIGDLTAIEYRPEARTEMALLAETAILDKAGPGDFIQFAGVPARVAIKEVPHTHPIDDQSGDPPPVPQIEPLDAVAMLGKIEEVVVFTETRDGIPQTLAVPPSIVDILLKKKTHRAPIVKGLVTHPIVDPRTGEIVAVDGPHAGTQLFLQGATIADAAPYNQAQAAEALVRIRSAVGEGFEFATPLDTDVAVAGLITGVQRRVLDIAPGLAILASAQASGKTTLARRIHAFLTGREMAVTTFPEGDETETQKRLLSMLLRSPAMVVFDNVSDGTTFRSGAIAAAMTGPVLVQRVLGETREAEAPTNTLFVITGNNLSLGADEVTRWLVANLAPAVARPEEREFAHPNVLAHANGLRRQILGDVVGLVAGYLTSGSTHPVRTRFGAWDRMVRQPLLWAGGGDLADVFRTNASGSEDTLAHEGLLNALNELFGEREFTAADVAGAMNGLNPAEVEAGLRSALLGLRAKNPNDERSVGRVLAGKRDRVGRLGPWEVRLVRRTLRGQFRYTVQVVE